MSDPYQKGPDDEWLKHSNAELAELIKKRDRRIRLLRFAVVILVLSFAWVVFKFALKHPISDLWSL